MSIQPLSNSSPVAEPASPRRRAADREAGGEKESFSLPSEEAAATTAATRESAGESLRETGETRRSSEEPASSAEKAPEGPAKGTASEKATSGTGAETAAGEKTKPSEASTTVPAGSPPVAQPSAPSPDIGALVSIAIAEQAEGQPVKPGKGKEASGQEVSGEEASGQETVGKETSSKEALGTSEAPEEKASGNETAVGEAKVEAAAVLDGLADLSIVLAMPATTPAQPIEQPATLVADSAARSVTAAHEGLVGEVAEAAGRGARLAGAPPVSTAKHGPPASEAEPPPSPAEAGKAAASDDARAVGEKTGQAQGPAPAQSSSPGETKPLEAFQQSLNAIDLSSLTQQGGIRQDAVRVLTASEQAAAQASAATTNHQVGQGQPTPLHVLPIEIGLRALAGARQFDIRLDPGELGRVDVNLSISDTGEVSARMVVDRVETLHLLQRDARTLERAFEQAGLKPSDAGVDITLRDPSDQSGFRQPRQQDEAPQRARVLSNGSEAGEETAIPEQSSPVRRFVRLGGVDMSV